MVVLFSKEVSPLRMKKAIRKYKRMKKFLEKYDENVQKVCNEASESDVKKVLPTVENKPKERLEPKSTSKEVTDEKLFISDPLKLELDQNFMSTDNLNGTKIQSAAKLEKDYMKNKTRVLTKNKGVNDNKSHPKIKQADAKNIITTNMNIGPSKKTTAKNKQKPNLKLKSVSKTVDVAEQIQKESSLDSEEIILKSNDDSSNGKSNNLPKKNRKRNKKKNKKTPITDSSGIKGKQVDLKTPPSSATVETKPKTSTSVTKEEEKAGTTTKSTQKQDFKKISILHWLNHAYLKMFFQHVLKTISENLLSTLTNDNENVDHLQDENSAVNKINLKNEKPEVMNTNLKDLKRHTKFIPKETILSNSRFVNQLFSKFVSADESSYKVHEAVSSITANFIRILCRVWWNAETEAKKLTEAERILKDAQQITRLLSIYCSIMYESYSSLVQLWCGEQVIIDTDLHNRLAENCIKANDTLAIALRDSAFEEELRKITYAGSIVMGEYLRFIHNHSS